MNELDVLETWLKEILEKKTKFHIEFTASP